MKKQYIILTSSTSLTLSSQVSEYLERGWQLHGSPFTTDQGNSKFCQALFYVPTA